VIRPEVIASLKHLFEEEIAFDRVLGLKIESLSEDGPRVRFEMRPPLVGHPVRKILHGGVTAAVLDATAGLAIMCNIAQSHAHLSAAEQMSRFRGLGTIDLRIDYVRPGKGEWFVATAQVLRVGNKVANVRMELKNDRDELIASGAAAFIL
jgi:uncharacterized protein (TIGR00369 family)